MKPTRRKSTQLPQWHLWIWIRDQMRQRKWNKGSLHNLRLIHINSKRHAERNEQPSLVKNKQGMEVLMFRGKNNFCKVSPAYPQWLTVTEHWAPARAADLPAWTAGMGPHEACSFLVNAARALMRPCLIIGIISFLYESLMQFYRMEVRWEGSSSWQLWILDFSSSWLPPVPRGTAIQLPEQ